jgi:hypothetical protein
MHLDGFAVRESHMDAPTLLPHGRTVALVTVEDEMRRPDAPVVATRDHELIRRWAKRRQAEPATGQATESGPSTVDVRDNDAGVRFNFPAAGRFRPIEWDEWFRTFDNQSLVFVYERDERAKTPSGRYRLVPFDVLRRVAEVV